MECAIDEIHPKRKSSGLICLWMKKRFSQRKEKLKYKYHRYYRLMNDVTTIQIDREIKNMLKKMGKKGETYSDIIRRLIKEVQYIKFMEEQYEILDNEKEWVSIDEI